MTLFQSTLPARGATRSFWRSFIEEIISIHAPRTGSDVTDPAALFLVVISIHAPRTGSDFIWKMGKSTIEISIHAPRTGSDLGVLVVIAIGYNFNPRSPHGERPRAVPTSTSFRRFQSTLPARGATQHFRGVAAAGSVFQSTLPARGATRRHQRCREGLSDFNPRSPHGERLVSRSAGCINTRFQSTLPARGATPSSPLLRQRSTNFNPRSPHGERQRKVTILSIRIIGFAQKVYHKTVLLRISLAENAVILPKRPQNPVRTSLQKAGGLRFARAIRAARPYSISSPSGA